MYLKVSGIWRIRLPDWWNFGKHFSPAQGKLFYFCRIFIFLPKKKYGERQQVILSNIVALD